jgi:hypothetical protein
VVSDVFSPLHTVDSTLSTTVLYQELKSSSDMHLAAQRNFPSSISPISLVYQQDTILDRGSVSLPQDLVWSLCSYIRLCCLLELTYTYIVLACKYTMRYHLILDNGAIIPFNLLSCAEIYQRALGGRIQCVDAADTV